MLPRHKRKQLLNPKTKRFDSAKVSFLNFEQALSDFKLEHTCTLLITRPAQLCILRKNRFGGFGQMNDHGHRVLARDTAERKKAL